MKLNTGGFFFVFLLWIAIALSQDMGMQGKSFKDAEPFPPIVISGDDWHEIKLSNPSFEEGSNDYPSDWDRWGKGDFFWSNEAFEGKRSVGLRKTDWSTGWKSSSFPVFADYQKEYPWYYCEAYVKTKGASGRIFLSIAWYGEKGWLGNSRSPYFLHPDTKAWYKMSLFALPPKGAQRGEIYLRADKEITGEVLFDSVKLYSLSFPLISPVGDDFDSPYISFISDYPSHPLLCYAYLQIAQTAEDKWEGKRDKQELLSAINEYTNLANLFPFWKSWALFKGADICIKGKEFKRAVEIGERLLKELPQKKGEACYLLSDAYKEAGEYEKSLSYAKQSLENSKEDYWFISKARMNVAYALEMLGKCEEALESYKELAEKWPDQRPLALLSLGGRYSDIGHYDTAVEIFKQLVSEYKGQATEDIIAEALWYIGRCYEHKLDFASALESYQQLLNDVSPQKIATTVGKGWYEEAKFNIGYCYLQLQKYEEAYRVWEEVLREEQGKGSDLNYATQRVLKSYRQVISPKPFSAQGEHKGEISKLIGPIYGILMDYKMEFRRKGRILIVYGTQSKNPKENQVCEYLASKVRDYLGEKLVCKKDTEVSEEEIRSKNLVLIGTPSSNKVLASLIGSLPIGIGTDNTIKVANRLYRGEDLGVIMVAPHPLNEELFVLVYSAFQPSILRNVFSVYHGATDYIVFSKQSMSNTEEPDPEKPSLEEGYFFKRPGKWEPFFSIQNTTKEVK